MAKRKLTQQEIRAAKAKARKLLESPQFFNEFLAAVKRAGLVGELWNALVLFIVTVSRLLLHPLSAFIKGRSAAGKNWLARLVLSLMPLDQVHEISSASKRAWNYSNNDFRHRVIYVQEASGAADPMRLLISEGKLIRIVTTWVNGKLVTQKYVTRGPVAAVSTTTRSGLEIDDETRHISILIDESAEQTRKIVQSYTKHGTGLSPDERLVWKMVHRLLEEKANDLEIVFPNWFDEVANSVFVADLGVRRYYPAFVEACRTVCLIRSFQRDRQQPKDGKLVLNFTDFALTALIFERVFIASLRSHEGSALETRQAVKAILESTDGKPVQAADLAKEQGISLDRAYKLLREAEEAGTITRTNGPEKNNPKLYRPSARPRFIPDPEVLLQTVDGAQDAVRFVHPLTGKWITYSRKTGRKNGKKRSN
jgi:hypothetical protein